MTKRSGVSCVVLALLALAAPALAQKAPRKAAPARAAADVKADALVSQMTQSEKLEYVGGTRGFYVRAIPRLNIPELKMSDGPMGVRNYGQTTAFPAGIALAASWDTALVNRVGVAMGQDARARGVHFLLGPGVNIHRAPMNGRNFEYLGEDPFLASRMAVAVIKGTQSQGVSATIKHFLANNQEWNRHGMDSDVDERTLREIYLPAFEAAVKDAHVGAIMDAYGLVNNTHMTENSYFNTQIARKEWGFTGVMMSDWVATYDAVAAANGGLDLEMPAAKFMAPDSLAAAIQAGKVSQATIDEKVHRILRTALDFGWLDRPQLDPSFSIYNQQARQVALDEARSAMVLLKNEGVLPLDRAKIKSIAVIGPDAYPAVVGGGGSSRTTSFAPVSFLQGISDAVPAGVAVYYAPGVQRLAGNDRNIPALTAQDALAQAVEAAKRADVVVLAVGFDPATESEGRDRTFTLPPGQDDLIKAVEAANKNVVVVLTAGGNVDMNGWVDQTPALLHAWYGGQEGGTALAQILFGDVNPSGKLPISMEKRWEDNPTHDSYYPAGQSSGTYGNEARPTTPAAQGHVTYSEGIFVGYRGFDKSGVKPRFPFGFGLSYTTFSYGNLKVTPATSAGGIPVTVTFDVTNTGQRAGAEVAEVYVADGHASVARPAKELKGFAKVQLKPGETQTITVALDRRAFAYYDVKKKDWAVAPGEFTILVGGSSDALPLKGTVKVK